MDHLGAERGDDLEGVRVLDESVDLRSIEVPSLVDRNVDTVGEHVDQANPRGSIDADVDGERLTLVEDEPTQTLVGAELDAQIA
jgi:hypothetical protein